MKISKKNEFLPRAPKGLAWRLAAWRAFRQCLQTVSWPSVGREELGKAGGRAMGSERLKAFSDGVLAIVITIMVLELKPPHGEDLAALARSWPLFLAYIVSFTYVAIYWNNHHHLFTLVEKVDGRVLWANIFLLFWLSLMPFATAWAAETKFAALPMAVYGGDLFACAVAYLILVRSLLGAHEAQSPLHRAIGVDFKGKLSVALYVAGMVAAFWRPWLAGAFYLLVAAIWLIPDRRIVRVFSES